MKVCPYCAGDIQDEAVVCRYCRSDLPPFRASAGRRRCPYCAEFIAASLTACNYCQREISLDPGAGFFEPSSEPLMESASFEPDAAGSPPIPAPPPSQPTSLQDILGSMDARQEAEPEAESSPETEEALEVEASAGAETEWQSHKTPPFSLSPAEEASFALGDWGQEDEPSFAAEVDSWEEAQEPESDLDSGSWHPEDLEAMQAEAESIPEDQPQVSSRDSAIFHRRLSQQSTHDSGGGQREFLRDAARESGSWKTKEDSSVHDSGSWRRTHAPPPGPPASRSFNYISQSSLRRSAISDRLVELDSATRGEKAPARPRAEGSGLHPGAFIVIAVAILSVALIYFLGPGRGALAFLLAPPTPAQVGSPTVQTTPTSLPTALRPLIKETTSPTATPSAAAGCLNWDEVTVEDVGKELCVQGTVKRWFATQDFPMVVIFSEEPATFIFVDSLEAPSFVKPGTCIIATGQVEIMGGQRPYIEFVEPPTVCDQSE